MVKMGGIVLTPAPPQPHPYRCETCTNPECPVWLPDNAKLAQRGKMREDHHILAIISKCGCCSHSQHKDSGQRIADVIKELRPIYGLYEKGLIDKQLDKAITLLREGK